MNDDDRRKRKETTRAAQAYLEDATTSAGWMSPAKLVEEAEQAVFALLTDKTGDVAKRVIIERACLCEAVGNALTEALTKVAVQSHHGQTNDLVKLSDAIVRTSIVQARLLALASAIQVKGDGTPTLLAQTPIEGDTLEMAAPESATPLNLEALPEASQDDN